MISKHLPSSLERTVLRLIAQNKGPIGQGTLSLLLRKQGFSVSTPTIGRRLQVLEFQGLLRKVGVDGRVITDKGMQALGRWNDEARLRSSGEALLETLKRGDKKHFLDLLSARRVIECETAALAAEHASAQSIGRMDELLKEQAASIEHDGLGIEQDVAFHLEIAKASQNEMLYSLVSLLRNHRKYDLAITSIRTIVGSRLVIDHTAILAGIKARDPEAARRAMEQHIRSLQQDLDRYWTRGRGAEKATV